MNSRLLIALILATLTMSGCGDSMTQSTESVADAANPLCVDKNTGAELDYVTAVQIADASDCLEQGMLKPTYFCNQDTGTWWIDLEIDKPGCSPACVVDVNDRTAVINWRCTGALPPIENEDSSPEPIAEWEGTIISNPTGSQFDDYFQRQIVNGEHYGIESLDPDIQAQIVALRDTGRTVRVWGTLHHNVPDYNASQIQVTRIEVPEAPAPPDIAEEAVDGWIGMVGLYPPGSQLSGYFLRDDGERYGIQPLDGDATVRQLIDAYQWTGAQVQVWGRLLTGVPDVENRQIQVERLEALSGPAQEGRNLSPFAEMSASSVLPSDRWGTYHAWSVIDGSLSTPWSEGVDGPGVGEWIMLEFPGAIEIHSIGIAVGYDRDEGDSFRSPEVFAANNRLQRATLIFSNGEQEKLTFSDTRGVQMIPLARAPNPHVTTFIKLVIDKVYPGARYDDTCIAEIEVWGLVK
jgi:hypothetical protein